MDTISDWYKLVQDISSSQIILGLAVTCLLGYYFSRKRYNIPPGPFSFPFIGNLLDFRNGQSFYTLFPKWQKHYGPVVSFKAGNKQVVVINTIDIAQEALIEKAETFSGRPFVHSVDLVTEGSQDILMQSYTAAWKYHRKTANVAVRQFLIGPGLEQRVQMVICDLAEDLKKNLKEPVDLHEYLSLCIFNVIHGLCFNTSFIGKDPKFMELLKIFDDFNENLGAGFLEDVIPPLRWLLPSRRYKDTIQAGDELNIYFHKKMSEHRQNIDEADLKCLADHVIQAQNHFHEKISSQTNVQFTNTNAAQIIADVFGAGVDTTRASLEWLFLVLADNPNMQEKIHKEIDTVLGDKPPGRENRGKLVYLEAVIAETMRRYPVAPFGVPHETTADATLGGYDIPAKTLVMINQTSIMNDSNQWKDPETFNPERFLEENGTKFVNKSKSWIPFSLGKRVCLGESLAKLNLSYIACGLLQKFKFSLPHNVKANFEVGGAFPCFPKSNKLVVELR